MDVLKLATNFQIPIEDGASLGLMTHIAPNEAEAIAVCNELTPLAVSHVEFLHDGQISGIYDDCVLAAPATRTDNEDGTVSVSISLRQKSDVEIRLDTVEGAIEDLGAAVSELAEV